MIFLLKKFLSALIIIILVSGAHAYADTDFSIKPDGDFYIYGTDNTDIAQILNITESELQSYCGEKTVYLALNRENTKQIRIYETQNDFTNSVVNISSLSNDKIMDLLPQITGIDNIKGEVIDKNGQKFIKTQLRSSDSGGEYIITEYITVAGRKSYVLSFYTDIDADTDYIEKTFETFDSVNFEKQEKQNSSALEFVLPAFTVIFGIITFAVGFTVVRDLRKRHTGDITEISQQSNIEQ